MLEKEKCDLSRYRLQRAKELIIDAESLFERESYKSSNNRAYYAVFSCMRAVLALDGEDFKKHSGVIQYFQRTYIKTGMCYRRKRRAGACNSRKNSCVSIWIQTGSDTHRRAGRR